jgi:hypothetical protein
MTQGRKLIEALKRKPHTYGEMQRLGISTSPQKRVMECLREDERILKWFRAVGGKELVTWRIVKVRK